MTIAIKKEAPKATKRRVVVLFFVSEEGDILA